MTDTDTALRERFAAAAATIQPTGDPLAGLAYRYRRHRARSLAGAGTGVVALAVMALQFWPGTSAGDDRSVTTVPATSSAVAPPAAVQLRSSGLTFTLPTGFTVTEGPTITRLGPTATEPDQPAGTSSVTMARSTTPGIDLTVATYTGEVAADANRTTDQEFFGSDPTKHVTVKGYDVRLDVVQIVPESACRPKPGAPSQPPRQHPCGWPLPHVVAQVAVGPRLSATLSGRGLSQDQVLAVLTSALNPKPTS